MTVFWEGAGGSATPSPTSLLCLLPGTANTLNPPTTQIGLFAAATQAIDITLEGPLPLLPSTERAPAHFKMAFDGCAVTNGTLGLLFATGLRPQAQMVRNRVEQLLQVYGSPVVCNVLGLSRGGVAAIFLGQTLATLDRSQVELNVRFRSTVPLASDEHLAAPPLRPRPRRPDVVGLSLHRRLRQGPVALRLPPARASYLSTRVSPGEAATI